VAPALQLAADNYGGLYIAAASVAGQDKFHRLFSPFRRPACETQRAQVIIAGF
jgi:hypothetical protein